VAKPIPIIPVIPEKLRMAALSGMLVPFVGSGVSVLAGCPNWKDFADKVMLHFVAKRIIPKEQYDQMEKEHPMVRLSYSLYLAKKHNVRVPFDEILHPYPGLEHPVGRRLYAYISMLSKVFVTTNYDRWLDQILAFPKIGPVGAAVATGLQQMVEVQKDRNVYFDPRDFTPDILNRPNSAIHLHGSLRNHDGMIMGMRHYQGLYANDRAFKTAQDENMVLTFLEYLFANRTLLFMGYGLEEYGILEHAVSKGHKKLGDNAEPRHFMLQGYLPGQEEKVEAMSAYYANECGVQLLPFLRGPDPDDWHQLIDVLEAYSLELPAKDPIMAKRLKDLEALLV
jgi:hypothetical protein